jgi:hypothetical protein
VTRHGEPIGQYYISDTINPGIRYSDTYAVWDAAIAAGATLEELDRVQSGDYSSKFLAHLIAWHAGYKGINSNVEDAKSKHAKSR